MNAHSTSITGVHLVGSVGLETVEEVFATAGRTVGKYLKRAPDGEPGPRRLWASFQYPFLRSSAYLRPDPSGAVRKTSGFPLLCLAEGVDPSEVRFGELGYAREARASYEDFLNARKRGELQPDARFQVCIPTPMGVTYAFCTPRDLLVIDAAYEAAMIREIERLCAAIPHKDLSIQWDFCHEMVIWDGQPQDMFPLIKASEAEIVERLIRICEPVPSDVELGFHLCYGDFGAKHFIEPRDATKMVEVCNAISASVKHAIGYIHMPIPIAWDSDDYFSPLQSLALPPETEVFLGLIHMKDGTEGALHRIAIARKYVSKFGIGTECGMARARKVSLIRDLLALHADVIGTAKAG